jgi:hypothetical protein
MKEKKKINKKTYFIKKHIKIIINSKSYISLKFEIDKIKFAFVGYKVLI